MALTQANQQIVSAKNQAAGAQTFTVQKQHYVHQLQFEPSAAPSAGTMTFSVRNPGATAYYDIATMDLTDATGYVVQIKAYADRIKATPALYDAAKTYSLTVFSSNE